MVKAFGVLILLMLVGCASNPYPGPKQNMACVTQGEEAFDCQIYKYSN